MTSLRDDIEDDKELQEYIKRETARMEENQRIKQEEPSEWEQDNDIELVDGLSNNKKRIIPEVHFTTKDIIETTQTYISPNSVVSKMLASNSRAKIEKLKDSFTKVPRNRVRTKRKWNSRVK
jgi:hypothetical protein